MEDDELLFEIGQHKRRSRTSFESVINKKKFDAEDLDDFFNEFH